MQLNEIFCPGCGKKVCDFVTYCPNCGFDIKSFRRKNRDQQVKAYFAKLYAHAPKNDRGFARNENDNENGDVFPSAEMSGSFSGMTKGYPSESGGYGDGYFSDSEEKPKRKPRKSGMRAVLLTIAIAVPCIALILLMPFLFRKNNDDKSGVSAPSVSDSTHDEVELKAGPERYISQDSIRCTITANTDDHILVAVKSLYDDGGNIYFVDVHNGIGEYMGPPTLNILGFVDCDDSIGLSQINTGYKYITMDGAQSDCRVEFTMDFNEPVTGVFVYDVEFTDSRVACRGQAVSVIDGHCVAVVTCSDVDDSGGFRATLIPKGFSQSSDELSETVNFSKMDISFMISYYFSVARSNNTVAMRYEPNLYPESLVLYTYRTISGGDSGEIGVKRYGCCYASDPTNVPVRFTDIHYGVGLECPEYTVDFHAAVRMKGKIASSE